MQFYIKKFFAVALLTMLTTFYTLASGQQAESTDSNKHTLTVVPGNPDAPAFTLDDINGHPVSLDDYAGKVVIINFWATWCPPCRYEMPSMQRAYQKLGDDGIEMLAVNVGEDSDTIFTFTADYPVEFPLIMDRTSEIAQKYGVAGIPATYVISPAGKIIYKAIGSREWDHAAIIEKIRLIKTEQRAGE